MKNFIKLLILVFTVFLFTGCFSTRNNTIAYKKPLESYKNNKAYKNKNISQALINHFKQWQGVGYKYGGESKSGVDCSYFVMDSFKQIDYSLPRTTLYQSRKGFEISKQNLQTGDLVFFITSKKGTRHVGIYLDHGDFMHVSTSKGVIISSLNNPYWKRHYWKAKRVLN